MMSLGVLEQLNSLRTVSNSTHSAKNHCHSGPADGIGGMDSNIVPSEIKKSLHFKMKMGISGLSPRGESFKTIKVVTPPSCKSDKTGQIIESTSKLDLNGLSSCLISDKSGGHTDLFPYIV